MTSMVRRKGVRIFRVNTVCRIGLCVFGTVNISLTKDCHIVNRYLCNNYYEKKNNEI